MIVCEGDISQLKVRFHCNALPRPAGPTVQAPSMKRTPHWTPATASNLSSVVVKPSVRPTNRESTSWRRMTCLVYRPYLHLATLGQEPHPSVSTPPALEDTGLAGHSVTPATPGAEGPSSSRAPVAGGGRQDGPPPPTPGCSILSPQLETMPAGVRSVVHEHPDLLPILATTPSQAYASVFTASSSIPLQPGLWTAHPEDSSVSPVQSCPDLQTQVVPQHEALAAWAAVVGVPRGQVH